MKSVLLNFQMWLLFFESYWLGWYNLILQYVANNFGFPYVPYAPSLSTRRILSRMFFKCLSIR